MNTGDVSGDLAVHTTWSNVKFNDNSYSDVNLT